MLSKLAPAIAAVALLATTARANDPLAAIRPGTPVIDTPGAGAGLPAGTAVAFTWHMPPIYAAPGSYEVAVMRRGDDGTWTRAAHGQFDGMSPGTQPIPLDTGTYVVYLTAVNAAGRTAAIPSPFTVVVPKSNDPSVPADGTTATGNNNNSRGFSGAVGGSLGPRDATPQPGGTAPAAANGGGSSGSSSGSSSAPADSKTEKPVASKPDAPAAKPAEKPVEFDPEVDTPPAVEGSVKPASGAGGGVAAKSAAAGEHRTVRGRLIVLPKAKLDFAKTIARVDAALAKLLADDARVEAGEDAVAPARVEGELEVWLVEVPKAPRKKGAAAEPVRRWKLSFDDANEAPHLRDKSGSKAAIEGEVQPAASKPATGEANELQLAKVVFMAPAH